MIKKSLLKKYLVLGTYILLPFIALSQKVYIENKTFKVDGCPIYFNGANTPWDNWNDFGGNYDASFWSTHFASLKANGINSSRVWISCNGDVQPNINTDGTVTGVSAQFWTNLDDYFKSAQANGIYIMATMMSFDHTKNTYQKYNSWRNMLNDKDKVQTYINNYLVPFVNRYKSNPYLMSIDICNEIEWIAENADNMKCSYAVLQRFVAMCAAAVHNNSDVLYTMGSASVKWNGSKTGLGGTNPDGNKWSDAALKAQFNDAKAYLDYYSPHYYAWMNQWYSSPFEKTPTQYGMDEKAVLVGETPCPGPGTPNITVAQSYENLKTNGYQGHYPWTSNGVDNIGNLSNFGSAALAFSNKYKSLVHPNCLPTGITSERFAAAPIIYPNPGSGSFNIRTREAVQQIRVFNIIGKEIFSINAIPAGRDLELDADIVKEGTYLLKVLYYSGASEIIRFQKVR